MRQKTLTEWQAPLHLECTRTRGRPALGHRRTQESFSHQRMRKMCASSMTLGFVFWETLNAHKIMNAMIVDHRNMWRKTQIPTYILLYQWTWVTLRRGTHKTPRSLRPFAPFLIHKCLFCLFFVLHFTFGTFLLYQSSIDQQRSTQAGDICPPSVQKVHSSLLMDLRLDLQAAAYLCFTFSRAVWAIFHIHPGSDFFFFFFCASGL